jgi:prevent-host-death family protein
MRTIPVQELKQHLAACLERVGAGERLTITRRNRPVAELGPPTTPGVHVGARFGRGHLAPLDVALPEGAVERVLADDRGDDR